ncbi:MAG TPA: MarR family transcriptional regulator [Marinobacter sp.]|uniref:MarR family winged helix-turn-helix transcriptional regulator n=1 Tax=Marinobacter sp. TaxID=50741 RepID=UPI002611F410|nr:MarR family transcriptional regulator [Marinobacter sp.]HET8801584.1 MarR family transcriptional regulator [Marinobacter sp.]
MQSSDATADLLTLDKQMCFALYSASLAMTKLYKPLLSEIGLTYPQYLVMLVLWEQDGITVSRLKDRLYLDYGTLTPLIKRLEKQDLLFRTRPPEDERQVVVHLTDKGRSLQGLARRVPEQVASASACSLAELEELKGQLCALRNRIYGHLESGAA